MNQFCRETGSIIIYLFETMSAFSLFIVNSLFAIVAIGAIVFLFFRYSHNYWKRRGIPSIPKHWFFGNLKDAILLQKSPATVFGELYHQGSDKDDVLGVYVLYKPFLMLRNPELIKQILIKDFQYFSDRYFNAKSFHDKIGTSNLFSIGNPEWKYLRTKMSPVFSSGKLKNLFPLIVETAESMKNYLHDQFATGPKTKTILVKEVALKYTTDIISSVAFGIHVNSFDVSQNKFYKTVQESLALTIQRGIHLSVMFFFPSLSPYIGGKMLGSGTDYFRKIFWNSMDTREMTKSKRGDLIDSLIVLKNEKQDNNFKFEGDALVSQSGIFFVAGRESSTATITFTLCELAKHPEIQKRTREEILKTLETDGLTYDSLQNMKFLHQVIAEILRLYPPAPLLDRVASVDYKIPGTDMVIEKGTPVYVPLLGIHKDEKYYSEPERFNPDRFSDENKKNIPQCAYMPFGDGPRVCIASRLGEMQSAVGIITILKDYEISLDPTYECGIDRYNIFISPPDGFRLNFTKL